eukprot:11591799-Prorocentrum_lima.AAC.2
MEDVSQAPLHAWSIGSLNHLHPRQASPKVAGSVNFSRRALQEHGISLVRGKEFGLGGSLAYHCLLLGPSRLC